MDFRYKNLNFGMIPRSKYHFYFIYFYEEAYKEADVTTKYLKVLTGVKDALRVE